eukprot:301779-Alexandrium_andersonii.AAC.1
MGVVQRRGAPVARNQVVSGVPTDLSGAEALRPNNPPNGEGGGHQGRAGLRFDQLHQRPRLGAVGLVGGGAFRNARVPRAERRCQPR